MELLQKIIDLGYEVKFTQSWDNVSIIKTWDKKGYVISIRGLMGFVTKCEYKLFPKCDSLETGLQVVYDFVKE